MDLKITEFNKKEEEFVEANIKLPDNFDLADGFIKFKIYPSTSVKDFLKHFKKAIFEIRLR